MNVPKLRFKEFQDQWKHKKIAEIVQKVSRPVDVELNRMYQQIGIRSHGKGLFHKEPVSGSSLGNKRIFWLDENIFVLNIVFAWEQAVAKTTSFEKGMVASHRFPMYKPKENLSVTDYFLHFFLTDKGKYYLGLASPGGAGRNKTLGQKNFEELIVIVPNVEEQTKIANFLTAIDEKISQLTQKYDLLKQYKKGVMQQIFSQKLRFKDDDGSEFPEWDNISLIELAGKNKKLFDDGDWIESEFITNSGVRLIQTGNIGIGNFIDKELKKYISDDSFSKLKCKEIFPGDILICRLAEPAGRACICPNTNDVKVITSVDVTIFRPLEKIVNRRYLINFFCTPEWFDNVTKMCGGSTRTRIARGALGKIQVRIPSLCEQTKIATFFTAIDDKITHTKTQLDAVRLYKKGLLQQMFV